MSIEEMTPVSSAADVQAARADLARLKLELRLAQREADAAQRGTREGSAELIDLVAAQQWLRATMGSWIETRRLAMVDELEAARVEARDRVEAARAEGWALVLAARADVVRLLSDEPASPHLLAHGETVVLERPPEPEQPLEQEHLIEREQLIESAPPLEPAADIASPEIESAAAPVAPALSPLAATMPGADMSAPVRQPDLYTAPSTALSQLDPVPTRSGASRFLYLDVILPFIAVVIVVVVLLAWVG